VHLVMSSRQREKPDFGRLRVVRVDELGKGGPRGFHPHETEGLLSGSLPREGVELSHPSLDLPWAPGTGVEPGSPVFYAMHAAMVNGLPPQCSFHCASHRITGKKRTIEVSTGSVVVMARGGNPLTTTFVQL
jgi:hypothetical protein